MAQNPFDQFDSKATNAFDQFDNKPESKPAGALRKLGDLGLSVAKGVIAVPEAAVGLADLATGGRVGKLAESAGVRFKDAKDVLTGFQSDDLKGKQQQFQQADGILDKIGVAVTNPSLIANAVAESVPSMGAGGVGARALMAAAPKLGVVGAGALGEGLVGAGSAAEQIRQQTEDGLLTGKQAALAGASGAATAAFGAAGGKVASKLGIGDVDTMIANGTTGVAQSAAQANKGMLRRGAEGFLSEGVLEELPQSLSEQILQNEALGKDWREGLDEAAVMAVLSGGAMGAGAGVLTGTQARDTAPPEPAGQLGYSPDPLISFPDGTVGRQADIDAFVAKLPEREQMSARARLMGLAPQPATPAADVAPEVAPVVPPSVQMGINPAAGVISTVAAQSVDSGQTQEIQLSQAAEQDQAVYEQAMAEQEQQAAEQDTADRPITSGPIADAQLSEEDKRAILFSNEAVADGGRQYEGTINGDILNGMGQPFATRYGAARRANLEGKDWTIAPVFDGWVARRKDAINGATDGVSGAATGSGEQGSDQPAPGVGLGATDGAGVGGDTAGRGNDAVGESRQSASGADDAAVVSEVNQPLDPVESAQAATETIANVENTTPEPAGTQAEAAPVEAGAPAPSDAAPAEAVPGAGAAPVESAGVAPVLQPGEPGKGAGVSRPTQAAPKAEGRRLAPAQAQQLQEAHKAHGPDVTLATVQKMYDRVMKMLITGKISNGGVQHAIKPKERKELQAQADRLVNDLSLFGLQPAGSTDPASATPQDATNASAPASAPKAATSTPALDRIAAGKAWFGNAPKAGEFINKNGLKDTHEWVKTGASRFEVRAKNQTNKTQAPANAAQAAINSVATTKGNEDGTQTDQTDQTVETTSKQPQERAPGQPVAESLPPTDIKVGDTVLVDGKPYKVSQGIQGGIAVESESVDLGAGVSSSTTKFLKGDDAIRAKIEADKAGLNEKPAADDKPNLRKTQTKRKAGTAEEAKAQEAARADYFTPGSIVKSYGGHDEVLAYNAPDENGRWSVQVHAVGLRDGKWVRLGRPQDAREHNTQPEARNLAAGPVARLPYQPAAEVKYSEQRGDGKAHTNAVDRGVAPMEEKTAPAEPVSEKKEPLALVEPESKQKSTGTSTDTALAATKTVAKETTTPQDASKTPLVDSHVETMAAVRDGEATPEQYKESFASVEENQAAVMAELNTRTKDALLRAGGPFFAMRNKGETKAKIADSMYQVILDEYALGKKYGSSEWVMSSGGFAEHAKRQHEALKSLVAAQTAESLAEYAAEVAGRREELQAERAKRKAAVENPQTLADFRAAMSAMVDEGKTPTEARLSLTPEQRVKLDELWAESTREAREQRKRALKTEVRAAGQEVGGEIIATKHTRKGTDLYVVKLAERVSKEDYSTLLASAKRLGGYYSAFRGNGAVPGFQFTDRDQASAFLKLAAGDTADAQAQAKQRRDSFNDDRSQTAVERLNEMADRLEARATESLGVERKANTARRARFAASAEASARADEAMAKTMRNLASEIADGKSKFLDAVRQKAQVEMLAGMVRTAADSELRAKYESYAEQERHKGSKPTEQTADYAEFPSFTAYRSDLASLGRKLLDVDGTKQIGQRLMKVADDVSEAYMEFAKTNLLQVSQFGSGGKMADFASREVAERAIKRSGLVGKAIVLPIKRGENRVVLSPSEAINRGIWKGDGDKRITLSRDFGAELVSQIGRKAGNKVAVPWQFESADGRLKALSRMGIEAPAEFRSALREFIRLQEQPAAADKVNELERAMIGRKNDGLDFFPTPEAAADEMVDVADVKEGMSVLEPSAGWGHIAERIRAAGVEPKVVEMAQDRRELLEAKGFEVVGRDFMELSPETAQYDRILMNPPFSDRRDAQHVQHAYELLKPGGRLVAIMGEGVFFGSDKKAQAFRDWLEERGGSDEKLQEGTFLDTSLPVNTGVNARMVVIDKPSTDGDSDENSTNPGATAMSRTRPAFSRGAQVQANESVEAVAMAIASKWENTPEIIVAFDMNDPIIPASVRKEDQRQRSGGATGTPEGFYYKGQVYLMSSKLGTANDIARVLFHETLGHYGLRSHFGKEMGTILRDVATLRRAEVDAKIKQYGLKGINLADRLVAAEEVLAELAQTRPEIGFVKRAIAAVRTWLRQNVPGFASLRLSDAELIRNYILPARQFVESGGGPKGGVRVEPTFSRGKNDAMTNSNVVGNTQGERSADDTTPGAHAARQILDAIKLDNDSSDYALRVIPGEFDGAINVGDALPVSKQWADGSETDQSLDGTSATRIRAADERSVMDALRNLGATGKNGPNGYYFGNRIVLVKGESIGSGEDVGESIIKNAEVVGIWSKPTKGLSAILPNESTAPDGGGAMFSRSLGETLATAANNIHDVNLLADYKVGDLLKAAPGKLSWWHKTVGTMYDLAQRSPEFKRVFDGVQNFINDVSYYATEAADLAPNILPKLESWKDITKSPLSPEDTKAISTPIFEGTLVWARDEAGKPIKIDALEAQAATLSAEQKAQRLLRNDKVTDQVLRMWQGLPLDQYEAIINGKYEREMLKAGVVWTDAELRAMFKLTDRQIPLYREFRAATDRSLTNLAISDMLRFGGKDVAAVREKALAAENAMQAGVMLRDHLLELADSTPGRSDVLIDTANKMIEKADKAQDLVARGYAPLSRYGQYTLDVVDASGERVYFGMFESKIDAARMARKMELEYPGATMTRGTVSEEEYKLFAGVSPETLELFGDMLGLEAQGDGAAAKAFQTYLKLAKSNRSSMKRMIQRKGIAGFSEDSGRVLAGFVYSNARQTASNLHMGEMTEAANEVSKKDGELKDQAVRLVDYVKNPREEAQAFRGLLFAQYIGGSIASAMVNMTQPITMTFPWLSQYGGAKNAAAQMTAAMRDANKRLTGDARLDAALKRAEEDGTVSPQEVHQLMQQSQGRGALQSGDGTRAGNALAAGNNFLSRVSLGWGKLFGLAEQFNRRATFIAAYRMAVAQDMKDPDAFARKAIAETQGIYCVDDQTECLTASGWKFHSQLQPGEKVYALDKAGALVESSLVSVHRFTGDIPATEFKNENGVSMVLTDDHTCLVQNYSSRDKKYQRVMRVKAKDVKTGHHFLRVPLADATSREKVYTDDEVALFAWVAAEGHLFAHRGVSEKRGVSLAQSATHNPLYVAEIDALLERLGGEFNRKTTGSKREDCMVCWQLRKPLWSKVHEALPGKMIGFDLVSKLTIPQMRIFLDTFVKGDGHIPAQGGPTITQKDVGNLDALQAMAILTGQTSTVYHRMGGHDFGALYIASSSKRAYRKEMKAEPVTLDMAWCPETAHGTWIARRNGRTFVTGNSKGNKPVWARGAIGGTLFTFKQYSIAYMEMLHRMYKSGPEGKKAALLALAVLFLMSGAGGLPGSDDLDDLISGLLQRMGYNFDTKAKRKEFFASLVGEGGAQFLETGISGLPGMPLDVSGRMGMGNLIPGTGVFQKKADYTRDVLEIAGPGGDFVKRGFDAAGKVIEGDVLGLNGAVRAIAPKAVQNLYQSYDMASMGMYRDAKGMKVLDTDGYDATLKAIGFQPNDVKKVQDASFEAQRMIGLNRLRESEIANRWALGIFEKDSDKVRAAREELREWNETNADSPIRINFKQILQRVQKMNQTKAERIAATAPKEIRNDVRNSLATE